jgi:hypothetical protein
MSDRDEFKAALEAAALARDALRGCAPADADRLREAQARAAVAAALAFSKLNAIDPGALK